MIPKNRPNILLFLTDQQHAGMMSCAGNPYINTPAMDRLASEGMRFERAYCANPVCAPSRFSLFTGLYSSEVGRRSDNQGGPIPARIADSGIGHRVRDVGYQTFYGGKEGFSATDAEGLGFEYICGDAGDELAQTCCEFLINRSADAPFFLVVSLINPHDICYMAIREYAVSPQSKHIIATGKTELAHLERALSDARGIPEREFWDKRCPPLPTNHQPQRDEPEAVADLLDRRPFRRNAREHWDEQKWRMHRWAYCRLTECADQQMGRVLTALDESGFSDSTVVFFTSDHGDHDASHKMEHKTALYEEACRVPFIIRDPFSDNVGLVDPALVCNGVDLFPTICDYAGAHAPTTLSGESLRSSVQGHKGTSGRDHVFIESEIGFAVRTERYMYVLHDSGANAEQLYDLDIDPGQTRNFAEDSEYEEELVRHRRIMDQYAVDREISIPS